MTQDTVRILLALAECYEQSDIAAWLRDEGYAVDCTTPDKVETRLASRSYHVLVLSADQDAKCAASTVARIREADPGLAIIVERTRPITCPVADLINAGADQVCHGIGSEDDLMLLHLMILRSIVSRQFSDSNALASSRDEHVAARHPLIEAVRNAGHDMSQPLTVIIGAAEMLLLDTPEESPMRNDLEMIRREAARLREIAAGLGGLVTEYARTQ